MQQITIIGQVTDTPVDYIASGKKLMKFMVRADNSPKDSTGSFFDFEVTTANLSLKEKLAVGSNIYVSGLLTIREVSSKTVAIVQGLVFSLLDRPRSMEDIKLEMVSRTIPLQDI